MTRSLALALALILAVSGRGVAWAGAGEQKTYAADHPGGDHPRGCAEAAQAWRAKITSAKGSADDVALSRKLAGQAEKFCRSGDRAQQKEGASIYERAILACDGSSKDPAYRY